MIVKITKNALWITIILTLSGCSSTAWEKRVLAVGWAKDNTPIALQWVPTGATIFVGRSFPVIIYASGGYYKIVHGSKSTDIDIPEIGMYKTPGQPSYKWFYIVDEERLLAAGSKYGGEPHDFAIEFDIRKNRILKEVKLKGVQDAPDSIIAEDLSYQASPTPNGLILSNLTTSEEKTVLPGCMVRYVRFSRDGQRLAALFMVPDEMIESFPFKHRMHNVTVQSKSGETKKWVGIAIVNVHDAALIDVKSSESSETWDFYRIYREFSAFRDYTYQQIMKFSFSPNSDDLIYMIDPPELQQDHRDKLFIHSLRAIGPFISPDGNRGGFYVLRNRVYWWNIRTGQYDEVVVD